VKRTLITSIALAVTVAALTAPATHAATAPKYDGYKSSYTQLHQLGVAAQVPDVDLKSSYPQFHQVMARIPVVAATGSAGVDWRDAGFGALFGAAAVGLVAIGAALLMRRHRLPALR